MTMRLLIGRAGSGKTTLCLEEIEQELQKGQDGPALIYLVPEQAAFQAEYALASLPGQGGTMRAQVLSFRRLAWRVLQETGGGRRLFIDDTGKGMMLRKILERQKTSLKIFRNASEKPGMMEDLVQLYNEMRRARIPVFKIKEYLNSHGEERGEANLLEKKLREVALLMEEAEQELGAHYIDAEDTLLLLALKLPQSLFTRGAFLWVDGFYGFTELEFFVIESLLRQVSRLSVTLCLDRDYPPGEMLDELNPFYTSALTCQHLQHLAGGSGTTVTKTVLPAAGEGDMLPRFKENPALAHLEQCLHGYPATSFVTDESSPKLPLKLVAAPGRRSEVEAVAREIIRLARDEHCRYRELAVVTHDLEQYTDLIIPIFNNYGIPYFLDQKRTVSHHPLVEFIRSALEVVNDNWRPDAVFRCIKSGFLFPVLPDQKKRRRWRERAAMLENYVLAFGIKGDHWSAAEAWNYTPRDSLDEEKDMVSSRKEEIFLKQINWARRYFSKPLLRYQEKSRDATLVRERVIALFELLEEVSAEKQLQAAADHAIELGEPERSREQEQVFQGIINLLDQLVEIMGEEKVAAPFFARIVDAGLTNMRLGLVPPSLDQVLVGNLERTRSGNVRVLFLLGANDGVLPSRPAGEAIFTEREREKLDELGFPLSPGARRRLLDEEFLIYVGLTRASNHLWVSYALADEEGRALMPSLLIARLQELFPHLIEEIPEDEGGDELTGMGEAEELHVAQKLLPLVLHPRRTLASLAVQLGRWKGGAGIHPLWWEVYNWYAGGAGGQEVTRRLLGGLFYHNEENALSPETRRELYGSGIKAGASRLEKYRYCPFSHFAAYGLRLRERTQHGLEAPDTGRFFHAVLRNVACVLQEQQLHWSDCSREELLTLVSTEVAGLLPRVRREILFSSRRYRHLARKMEETVGRAVLCLAEHDRRSDFKPLGVEIAFGGEGDLPPLLLPLPDGQMLELVGRIDRLDGALTKEGIVYLRVIDFKSGPTDLNLAEVNHGLSLQLLLYLEAVLANAGKLALPEDWQGLEVSPAGVFYFRVHDPLLSGNAPMAPEAIQEELFKLFKLRGKVLAEPHIVKMMDRELESGYSKVLPVGISKKGELYRSGKALLTAGDFELLRRQVRAMAAETAASILAGSLEISPFKMGKKKACTYCPYKPVCQFDLLLEENRYRILTV